jgi:hypothetical protein
MSHTPGWNMSISSLARFNKTGIDTIKTAVKELETYGYLKRSMTQEHNPDGTFADFIWTTADPFQNPATALPASAKQDTKKNILKEEQVKKNKQENKASRIDESWKPSQKIVDEYPVKYPGLNYAKELTKFINYYLSKDMTRKDWDASYRNWLINAMDYQGIKPEEQNKPLPKLFIGRVK